MCTHEQVGLPLLGRCGPCFIELHAASPPVRPPRRPTNLSWVGARRPSHRQARRLDDTRWLPAARQGMPCVQVILAGLDAWYACLWGRWGGISRIASRSKNKNGIKRRGRMLIVSTSPRMLGICCGRHSQFVCRDERVGNTRRRCSVAASRSVLIGCIPQPLVCATLSSTRIS